MSVSLNTIDAAAVRRGNVLVHVVIIWMLIQSSAVVGWRVWEGDKVGVVLAMFDLMVSAAFSYALRLGHTWARYLTIVANGLAIVVLFLVVGIFYPAFGLLQWGLVSTGFLVSVAVIFVMLMSSGVDQFFQHKKLLRGARRYELLAAMSEEQRGQVTVGRALVFLSILFFMLLNLAGSVGYLGAILDEVPTYGSLIVLVAWVCCLALWNGSRTARWVIVLHSLSLLGLVVYGSYQNWGRLEANPRFMLPSATFVFTTTAIVLMLSLFHSVSVFLRFQWDLPAAPRPAPLGEIVVTREDAVEEPRVIDYTPDAPTGPDSAEDHP